MKGGNGLNLQAIPVQTYAFQYGSSPSENAVKMMEANAAKQNALNNALAGGGKRKLKKRMKGGDAGEIVIPQFPQMGPQVGPQGGNSAALEVNKVLINAINNAANDSKIGTQKGGSYKYRKNISNKSFKRKKKCYSLRCIKLSKRKKYRIKKSRSKTKTKKRY